jgi:hypothetical protein
LLVIVLSVSHFELNSVGFIPFFSEGAEKRF